MRGLDHRARGERPNRRMEQGMGYSTTIGTVLMDELAGVCERNEEQFTGVCTDLGKCQGHSHPKLLVALDVGSKSSADKIQPTTHRLTGYGQYSGVVPWPLNNDGRCYVKLRSV